MAVMASPARFYTGALQTVTYEVPRYKFQGCGRLQTNRHVVQSAGTERRNRDMRGSSSRQDCRTIETRSG